MKIKALFLILSIGVVFASCSKEDCSEDALSTVLVGTWTSPLFVGDVEFKADGTIVDPNDDLIGGEINGVVLDEKTYTVNGNTGIDLVASKDDQSLDASVDVTGYDCDEVTLSLLGIPITMTRK